MLIATLIRRIQRVHCLKEPLSTLGAAWLLILIPLAWIEFEIICFWGPLFIATHERTDDLRKRRRVRRRKPKQDRNDVEVDSEG